MNYFKTLVFSLFLFITCAQHVECAIPTVTNVSPFVGSTAGGTSITITGTDFTGATAVRFGPNSALSFIVNSNTSITAVSPPGVIGNVSVFVTTPDGTSIASTSAASYFTYQGDWFAFATINTTANGVTPIDTATDTGGVLIGTGSGTGPIEVAITPDGTTAYTTNGNASVSPIDIATKLNGANIDFSMIGVPGPIAINPEGTIVYVGENDNIVPITIATGVPGSLINIVPMISVQGIAITPDGSTAYVTVANNNVYPVTLPGGPVGAAIAVGTNPTNIAITPDGTKAYVCNSIDVNSITPIDLTMDPPLPGSPIMFPDNLFPVDIAITPNGSLAYVSALTDGGGGMVVITLDTNATDIFAISDSGIGVSGVVITPDGLKGYVIQNDTMTPSTLAQSFSIPDNTLGSTISLAESPNGIAITPDPSPVARFVFTSGNVSSSSSFDASNSVTAVGSIALYEWDFGDGNSESIGLPTTTHTYALPGNYTVTLTVTNTAGTSTGTNTTGSTVFTGQTMSRLGSALASTQQQIQISGVNGSVQPPINLEGHQKRNRFLTQTDLINIVTWSAPASGNAPVIYKIYRNNFATLIGTVLASEPLCFQDNNRKKDVLYTYYIISVDAQGNASTAASVVIK